MKYLGKLTSTTLMVLAINAHAGWNGNTAHSVTDWMKYTWRSAAFDNSDNFQGFWQSQGYHFYMDDYGRKIYDAYTEATDCAPYDGWWDKNKLMNANMNSRNVK